MLAGHPPFYEENPFGIYQKILEGKFDVPRSFDPKVRDVVRRLLTADRTKRLGGTRLGAAAVKQHKWFGAIAVLGPALNRRSPVTCSLTATSDCLFLKTVRSNWETLQHMQVEAPYLPTLNGDADTSRYDKYPDSEAAVEEALSGEEAVAFSSYFQ